MWITVHGPIHAGLFVCHSCNNKKCINPNHLYLATNQKNIQDAYRDGLCHPSNAKKTHCSNCGGEYSLNGAGRRVCKDCRNASNRRTGKARRAARRAAL